MTSIIEAQRLSHTELEKLEDALCSLLMLPSFNFSPSTSSAKPPTQKERLTNEHRARNLIDRIVEKSRELWDIYKDDIGLRKEEMQRLNVHEAKGPGGEAGIATFYGRLANIKKLDQQAQSLGGTNQRGVDEVQVDFAALEGEDVGDGRDCEFFNVTTLPGQWLVDGTFPCLTIYSSRRKDVHGRRIHRAFSRPHPAPCRIQQLGREDQTHRLLAIPRRL